MTHETGPHHLQPAHDAPMNTIEGFEPWLRANGCGDSTVHDRIKHVNDFGRCHKSFPASTTAEVTGWLGRPDYAQWSRSTYYGHLRSFYKFAAASGLVETDPMVLMRRPKPGMCVPRPLTGGQVAAVMLAATPQTRAWLTLGLYAGLRAFEVAKIRGQDVTQDSIFVVGKGGREDSVPTHPLIWELAQTMPSTWWFPSAGSVTGHVGSVWVTTGTTRLFKGCGVEGSIHRTRHTFATRLLRSGVNVRVLQSLMRHAALSSTMIYCLVEEDERRVAIGLLAA